MEAQVWTLIGVLSAALLAVAGGAFMGFLPLAARIDGLGSELGSVEAGLAARIDGLGSELRSEIRGLGVGLGARIDALSTQLSATNARIDAHLEGHEL